MTTVLMTVDCVGGVWTYALDLADALAPYGVTVHLATMGPRMTAGQRAAVSRSAVATVHESDHALEWMADPWADVDAAGEWLRAVAADCGPDVLHLNGYVHAADSWQIPVVVVAHSDVVSWWHAVHGVAPPPEWDTYRRRVGSGLHAADAVVAPTAAVAADLARHYGRRDVHVVPNGRRDRQAATARKVPLVAAAGRVWDEAKNLAAVQRVAPRLRWPVQVAEGSLPAEEVASLFARASVFVAPARYEPFGLAALEAAQAGCALVLGDIASLREVWGDAAVYVDPSDDEALVAAVDALVADEAARAALAAAAQERARTFTLDRTARGYLDVYARLPVRSR